MAEYFAESVFTGDGMVTGVIPASRLRIIKQSLANGKFRSFREMMLLSHEKWNVSLTHANYDQAWSLAHFLMQSDKGKYQEQLAKCLALDADGKSPEEAWTGSFGSLDTFEQKWKAYWLSMPDNPTLDLYAQAVVSSLTSFLGRAYSQGQTFKNLDEFLK